MSDQQTTSAAQAPRPAPAQPDKDAGKDPGADFDGLAGKKPEQLTPEELRLMADTMPGDSPGD